MKKLKLISFVGIVAMLIVVLVILPACNEPGTTVETVVETVTETVTETVEVEKEDVGDMYTFEALRAMADAGVYEGAPAAEMTLLFNNILEGLDFAILVENGIIDQWALAGGTEDNLTIVYNDVDPIKQAQILDLAFNTKPDGWLEFYAFEQENKLTGTRAKEAGLFIVAIDIPVMGFPFMGANNYGAGRLLGETLTDYIDNVWGGWDMVDLVLTPYSAVNGPVVNQRVLEPVAVMFEKYGDSAAYSTDFGQLEGSKVVVWDGGGNADLTIEKVSGILAANPDAEYIVTIEINAQGSSGYRATAETVGRWDAEKWLVGCHGGEGPIGHELIRDGSTDFDIAYFPEKYGNYLVPAVIANYYGNPVPADIFVDHVALSLDNIDEYYPEG